MDQIKQIINQNMQGLSYKKMSPKEYAQYKVDMQNKMAGTLNDGITCDICKNKGLVWKLLEDNGYYTDIASECQCMKKRKIMRKLKKSGLKNTGKFKLDNFETDEKWQEVLLYTAKQYIHQSVNEWFFIAGQSGCGKSMLCTAICLEFIEAGRDVHYMVWKEDAPKLKALMVADFAEYQKQLNYLKTVDILYIDDLFKTGNFAMTNADINLAFEVINHRYNEDKKTIISSELLFSEIRAIDTATAGRIVEKTTKAYILQIAKDDKKDYRAKEMLVL